MLPWRVVPFIEIEVLVSADWLADHLQDPSVRIVEVDVDTAAYSEGHIPGAIAWSWKTDFRSYSAGHHSLVSVRDAVNQVRNLTGDDCRHLRR
jgi:3-mercaptopyruvate sulfurtransferase SseA